VKCKVVDVLRYPDLRRSLQREVNAYAALKGLQGEVIPKFYGFYNVWGIIKLLALEPVGEAITEDEVINAKLRLKMKAALGRIHDEGYVHGDISRRNFCKKKSGKKTLVFLVFLEMCRLAQGPFELNNEMSEVDKL
jgi:tRNA A-37 threonylcarbamoyl transferase component Bud32